MKKPQKTQTSDIKKYLETHKKGLTQKDAEEKFGAIRLASIIHNLRHKYGMNIVTTDECTKNRYGTISRYARYTLA